MSDEPIPYPTAPSLARRMLSVMQGLPYIQKRKEIDLGGGRRIRTLSYEDLAADVQPLLVQHGVLVLSSLLSLKVEVQETEKSWNGEVKKVYTTVATVEMEFTFINADDSADRYSVRFPGMGFDTSDKAVGKATTYAAKDCFRKVFVVPSGEEPEDDNIPAAPKSTPKPKQPVSTMAPGSPVIVSATVGTTDPLIDRFTPKPEYDDATAAIARINACATVADLDALKNKMIAEKPRFSPEEAPMVKEAGAQRREKLLAESAKPLTRDAALASIAGMMTKLGAAKWGSMLRAMDCNPAEKNWHQNLALPAVLALEAQMKEAAK